MSDLRDRLNAYRRTQIKTNWIVFSFCFVVLVSPVVRLALYAYTTPITLLLCSISGLNYTFRFWSPKSENAIFNARIFAGATSKYVSGSLASPISMSFPAVRVQVNGKANDVSTAGTGSSFVNYNAQMAVG